MLVNTVSCEWDLCCGPLRRQHSTAGKSEGPGQRALSWAFGSSDWPGCHDPGFVIGASYILVSLPSFSLVLITESSSKPCPGRKAHRELFSISFRERFSRFRCHLSGGQGKVPRGPPKQNPFHFLPGTRILEFSFFFQRGHGVVLRAGLRSCTKHKACLDSPFTCVRT